MKINMKMTINNRIMKKIIKKKEKIIMKLKYRKKIL